MSESGTRANGLQLRLAGSEVGTLRAVARGNGVPGVAVLVGAAANGEGAGRLDVVGGLITWTPPGGSPGPQRALPPDGVYLLEGDDPSKWIRVQVAAAFLPALPGAASCEVDLEDGYNNLGIAGADVAATDATAGLVSKSTLTLTNASPSPATTVKLWIDASVSGITVSIDNVTFAAPTSAVDVNVLAWTSIAAGASVNVYVKRTIAAGAAAAISVLDWLHWQWKSFT